MKVRLAAGAAIAAAALVSGCTAGTMHNAARTVTESASVLAAAPTPTCASWVGKIVTDQDAYTTCVEAGKTYHADLTACVGDDEFVSFGPWYGGQVGEAAAKKLIPFEMVDPGTCAVTVS